MFEPLLLHLFLLYSSLSLVNLSMNYLKQLLAKIIFLDKVFLVLAVLLLETFSHMYFLYFKSQQIEGTEIEIKCLIPLHTMVLISLLSCSALEGIKKRIHEVHQRNYAKKRRAEIVGMPPSYITVETSYDCLTSDFQAENMELHNYSISRKVCETSSFYKSVLQNKRILYAFLLSSISIAKDDNLQELMKQNIFQKLTVMRKTNSKLTLPNCNYQMLKVNASSRENISELLAKNIKERWYVECAGRLQLIFTSSFMTIVLIVYNYDYMLFFINTVGKESDKQNNLHSNVSVSCIA